MSRVQAESITTKIIREITQKCTGRGLVLSETLVAFMVRAVMLDPSNGFNVDRPLTEQDVQQLEELCLSKLVEKCSPFLDTIRMQLYFDKNYTSRCEFLEEIRQSVESRLSPVRREITDGRGRTREDFDALYRKIVSYTVLHSGVGSVADVRTLKEATAALQSIFPQTELGAFMVLLKKEKEQQLNELSTIVTGIRLFNTASEEDSEQTDLQQPILALLNEALPVSSKSIEDELSVSQGLAWKYTAVLEKLLQPDGQSGGCDVPVGPLKRALYNIRQHEAFLKTLLTDAHLCSRHMDILQAELSSEMKLLKETVKAKRAVHTAHVFPLFKALSKLWSGLQEEAELLRSLRKITLDLQPFITSQAERFSAAYLDSLLEDSEVKTDKQRMTEFSDEHIFAAEMETHGWLLSETPVSFAELPLQFSGFCGYALVSRDGLLLPGNPHLGVFKHKEKFYVFSSKEAALKFASRSGDFIARVAEQAKRAPELVQLLKLHQQDACAGPYSEMQPAESSTVKPTTRFEAGTQTDVHPMETNIVKTYEWNEWELRRNAIKLANLCTKSTRSTQTNLSHMRRENVTQTWLPKNASTQSKRDSESNVPRPHVYLAGLRGQKNAKFVKTNLTRSVEG